ncbi:MAG: proline dehydrogenase family protein [Blastocatellia bacterium]|nr:proline dehydrogenase family protein [Blastocatellia bacterium]
MQTSMSDFTLDFQDTETAFADKTDSELREKYRLFKILNSPFLNSLGTSAATFALSLGLPVKGLIKKTIYEQFCGGETIEESEAAIKRLAKSGIGAILDYSVEGKSTEEAFDFTKDEIIRTIERAKDDPAIPFSVFKVTGIAPLGTLEKMSSKKKLDAKGQAKCERIHSRVNEICEFAHSIGQPIFIDAEDSWIQDAIDRLATEMMEKFNRDSPIVYNTIQMYRTDRLEHLKEARRRASSDGYFYGVKIVRGAYMEKERERAAEMGYPSPIHEEKKGTDHDYDAAVEYCLKHVDEVSFVAGTHNEKSTQRLVSQMYERRILPNHPHVYFSQLYGMSDNLTYVLAKNGYNVTKYVPYGPVEDAVPYLIRRAEENTATAGQVSRELDLIAKELKRRKAL